MAKLSVLDTLPKNLNVMQRAQEITKLTISVGFKWQSINQVILKIEEELEEVKECLHANNPEKLEEECGDLLLSTIILCAYLEKDAEKSLDLAIKKFEGRFQYVEQYVKDKNKTMKDLPFDELCKAWKRAKG